MPSVSKSQSRLMHGIASGSIKPTKDQPSRAVARDYAAADKGRSQAKLPDRVKKK